MYEHLNSQASPHCIATFTLQEGQLLWVSFNLLRYELWRVKQVKKEPTYAYIKDLRDDVRYDEVILGNSGAGLLCQYRIICMVMVVWLLRYCPAGAILGGWGKCCLWGKISESCTSINTTYGTGWNITTSEHQWKHSVEEIHIFVSHERLRSSWSPNLVIQLVSWA